MTVISAANRIKESFEAINRRDLDAAMEAFAEDVVLIEPTYDEPQCGRDRFRKDFEGFLEMVPDIHFQITHVVADRDQVVTEWTYTSTYRGRHLDMRECCVQRLDERGRVKEVRLYFDRLKLHEQVGLLAEEVTT